MLSALALGLWRAGHQALHDAPGEGGDDQYHGEGNQPRHEPGAHPQVQKVCTGAGRPEGCRRATIGGCLGGKWAASPCGYCASSYGLDSGVSYTCLSVE